MRMHPNYFQQQSPATLVRTGSLEMLEGVQRVPSLNMRNDDSIHIESLPSISPLKWPDSLEGLQALGITKLENPNVTSNGIAKPFAFFAHPHVMLHKSDAKQQPLPFPQLVQGNPTAVSHIDPAKKLKINIPEDVVAPDYSRPNNGMAISPFL